MAVVLDIVSWVFLVVGGLAVLTGGIGVVRLPDVYARSHAAGITDTAGAGLILIGLMFQGGLSLVTIKLVLILIFLLFTSPTSSHALVHTAYATGLKPILDHDESGPLPKQEDEPSKPS